LRDLSWFLDELGNIVVTAALKIVFVVRVDCAGCPTVGETGHTQLSHVINATAVEKRLGTDLVKRGLDRQRGLYIGHGVAATDKFHRTKRTVAAKA
jgi:hypothetical protein